MSNKIGHPMSKIYENPHGLDESFAMDGFGGKTPFEQNVSDALAKEQSTQEALGLLISHMDEPKEFKKCLSSIVDGARTDPATQDILHAISSAGDIFPPEIIDYAIDNKIKDSRPSLDPKENPFVKAQNFHTETKSMER